MGNKVSCTTGNKEDKADAKAEREAKDNLPTEKKEDTDANGDAKQVATVEISRSEDGEVRTPSKPDEKDDKAEEKGEDKKDDVTETASEVKTGVVEEIVAMTSTKVMSSPQVTSAISDAQTKKDDILEDIVQSVSIETVKLSVTEYIDDAAGGADSAKSAAAKGAEAVQKTVEKYDLIQDMAKGKENFLLQFRNDHKIHAVDFMRIWRNFDKDKSGYLEKKELTNFLRDLIEQKGEKVNKKKVEDYEKIMMQTFDTNKDKVLELSELSQLLPVEQNFFAKYPVLEKCTKDDFNKIFDHFDKDKTGKIGHTELLALMKEMFAKEGPMRQMKVPDLEAYADGVFGIYDTNKDGTLSREELSMVISKS